MDEVGGATTTTMIGMQCDQLNVMLEREVRYQPSTAFCEWIASSGTASADSLEEENGGVSSSSPFVEKVAENRMKMCDWTMQMVTFYEIPQNAAHVAMNMFDRVQAARFKVASSNRKGKQEFHSPCDRLVMGSCLFLALKLISNGNHTGRRCVLSSKMLEDLSKSEYTAQQFEEMEEEILQRLEWLVHPPTSHDFLHAYIRLLTLAKQLEEQQQQQVYFDAAHHPRQQRATWGATGPSITAAGTSIGMKYSNGSIAGASFYHPSSGSTTMSFHCQLFSGGAGGITTGQHHVGYNSHHHARMKSIEHVACDILGRTLTDAAFLQYKPSVVAMASLYYALQELQEQDEAEAFWRTQQHLYLDGAARQHQYYNNNHHHHPHSFPNPLEEMHQLGVMVDAAESPSCMEAIIRLVEEEERQDDVGAPPSSVTRRQMPKRRANRTTSPHSLMDQLEDQLEDQLLDDDDVMP